MRNTVQAVTDDAWHQHHNTAMKTLFQTTIRWHTDQYQRLLGVHSRMYIAHTKSEMGHSKIN